LVIYLFSLRKQQLVKYVVHGIRGIQMDSPFRESLSRSQAIRTNNGYGQEIKKITAQRPALSVESRMFNNANTDKVVAAASSHLCFP